MQHGLLILSKVLAVAFAVGFDVLALSIAVGIARLNTATSIRVGSAFAAAEIGMQLIGYSLGAEAGEFLGHVAGSASLTLLFLIGWTMIAKSFEFLPESHFDTARGGGLLLASLSISLDSLGVGIALPALGIPLVPLLITTSMTTVVFTYAGLTFGAMLGERYERGAEGAAGAMLVLLAGVMAFERLA